MRLAAATLLLYSLHSVSPAALSLHARLSAPAIAASVPSTIGQPGLRRSSFRRLLPVQNTMRVDAAPRVQAPFLMCKPDDWDQPLFVSSPTLYLLHCHAPAIFSAATASAKPALPPASPVLDPAVRLVQADAARLASHLRTCNLEDGCHVALEWGKARLPLLQWVSTLLMPPQVREVLPVRPVPLASWLEPLDPWNVARNSWSVAPLRTTRVLVQVGWLIIMQRLTKKLKNQHDEERQGRRIARLLSSLTKAFEGLAAHAL